MTMETTVVRLDSKEDMVFTNCITSILSTVPVIIQEQHCIQHVQAMCLKAICIHSWMGLSLRDSQTF